MESMDFILPNQLFLLAIDAMAAPHAPLERVIFPDGSVDWEAFQELVSDRKFLVYDPPQMLAISCDVLYGSFNVCY